MARDARVQLDSLTEARFFAAICVVLFHGVIAFGATATWFGGLTAFGFTGVSFFFTLSGFVLTWAARDAERPRRFYLRRLARIYPIYALTWLAAVLYAAVGSGTVFWRPVLLGATLLQGWSPHDDMAYNFPAWSLSDEAFFYALFPLLIKPISRMTSSRAATGMCIGWLWMLVWSLAARMTGAGPTDWLLYSFPLYRLGEFVCGMCLAIGLKQGWRPRVSPAVPLLVLLGGAVACWRATELAHPVRLDRDFLTLLVIPVELLLIASLTARDVRPHKGRSRTLLELGNASYALYISHALVLFAWGALRLSFAMRYLVVYVVVCLVGSLLLHWWVERPLEEWLKRLLSLRDARLATSTATKDIDQTP